jgi:hypothetical protein
VNLGFVAFLEPEFRRLLFLAVGALFALFDCVTH